MRGHKTIKECAEIFDVHERTIRYWLKKGYMDFFQITKNGTIWISDAEIVRVKQSRPTDDKQTKNKAGTEEKAMEDKPSHTKEK